MAEEGPLAGHDFAWLLCGALCGVSCSCVITYAWSSTFTLLANAYLVIQCVILVHDIYGVLVLYASSWLNSTAD